MTFIGSSAALLVTEVSVDPVKPGSVWLKPPADHAVIGALLTRRPAWEFLEALGDAGHDPVARAETFHFLHLGSYSFWLGAANRLRQ